MLGGMFGRYAKQPSTFRAFAVSRSAGATAPVIVATNTDQLLSTSTQSPWSFTRTRSSPTPSTGPRLTGSPAVGLERAGFDPAAAGWTVSCPLVARPRPRIHQPRCPWDAATVDRAAFQPVSTSYHPEYPGGHVFDFGRNIVGTCSISATAASINSTVVLGHGRCCSRTGVSTSTTRADGCEGSLPGERPPAAPGQRTRTTAASSPGMAFST